MTVATFVRWPSPSVFGPQEYLRSRPKLKPKQSRLQ